MIPVGCYIFFNTYNMYLLIFERTSFYFGVSSLGLCLFVLDHGNSGHMFLLDATSEGVCVGVG